MAKDKEEIKTQTEKTVDKYFVTDNAKTDKYYGKIDNTAFVVMPAIYMITNAGAQKIKNLECYQVPLNETAVERLVHDDSCLYRMGLPDELAQWKTGGEYFENLTPIQIHQLTVAKLIRLDKDQAKKYTEFLRAKNENNT